MVPFQSILLPVMEAEPLIDEFRQDGDWSRTHGIPAHVTLAGPWPLSVELSLNDLSCMAQEMIGQRYELSAVDVLGDAVCLLPDDDSPLMVWRSRLLGLAGVPDDIDNNWRLHLTVCRDSSGPRTDEVERALAGKLPLSCAVQRLLLAQMRSPSEVAVVSL
jgi:hypothetical protein